MSVKATARAPREALSLDAILAAAMRVIDDAGVDALSIRRLGEELGYSPMMIYRHVRDKDDLLDRLVAGILDGVPLATGRDRPWDERLFDTVYKLHNVFRDHPGLTDLIMRRSPPLAAFDPFREAMLQSLQDAGLEQQDAVDALTALVCHVLGHAHAARARQATDAGRESDRLKQLPAQKFPRLVDAADTYATHISERAFERGIRSLISGLVPNARL